MSKQAKFNRDDVIKKAKDLYWEKGYHATSMRNLQDVVDMRPGSIYAAFGSKENLFNEALNCYAQESTEYIASCVSQEKTALDGLKYFLRSITTCNKSTTPSGMCMIVKSIAELTQNDHPDLLSNATQILGRIEELFSKIFQQAINNGEISATKNPAELARYFQIQLIGLRTYAQVTNSPDAIDKFIDDIFKNLLL